jgi:dienelactone hydrolase
MKKLYIIICASFSLASATTYAQQANCSGSRFHDYAFPALPTPISNVQYGSNLQWTGANQNLKMDIYQPVGDVATLRPLIIIAHGGSFVYGSKTGSDVVPLCQDLARMGYVTASIDYRLGMTHLLTGGPPHAEDAGPAVMRGTHDARAAVRYFRKNARIGGNTYNIDTNNIFFAGVSAGGFIALHLAYLDQTSELLPYIDTLAQQGLLGGVEGVSGNPGYSSKVKAIINICGALADTSFMHTGDTPLLSFHGNADGTVPYANDTIYLLNQYPILKVHGSSTIAMRANHQGIENCFVPWYGANHVPEVGTSPANVKYYDSTITITRNFLEHFMCGVPKDCNKTQTPQIVGIEELALESNIAIYPNPAQNSFIIDLSKLNTNKFGVEMYNALGAKVTAFAATNRMITIERNALPAGIYLVNIIVDGKTLSKKVIFE